MNGEIKTYEELRQSMYERILDESMFIARASEGAISVESILEQPIFIRKKYLEEFKNELQDRKSKIDAMNSPKQPGRR